MADTGWLSAGTMATVDRDAKTAWTDPDNAKVSDNSDTQAFTNNTYTDWLRATNFGAAVPVGATIDGVLLSIEKNEASGDVKDSSIRLRTDADGQIGDDKATVDAWPAVDTYIEHGGAADDWNAVLDDADVNHANFGFDISFLATGFSQGRIDHIRVKIYYTEGGGGGATIGASTKSRHRNHGRR